MRAWTSTAPGHHHTVRKCPSRCSCACAAGMKRATIGMSDIHTSVWLKVLSRRIWTKYWVSHLSTHPPLDVSVFTHFHRSGVHSMQRPQPTAGELPTPNKKLLKQTSVMIFRQRAIHWPPRMNSRRLQQLTWTSSTRPDRCQPGIRPSSMTRLSPQGLNSVHLQDLSPRTGATTVDATQRTCTGM